MQEAFAHVKDQLIEGRGGWIPGAGTSSDDSQGSLHFLDKVWRSCGASHDARDGHCANDLQIGNAGFDGADDHIAEFSGDVVDHFFVEFRCRHLQGEACETTREELGEMQGDFQLAIAADADASDEDFTGFDAFFKRPGRISGLAEHGF